ncbi:putative peroxisomal membrane protein pex31 [Erysiphe necator]|uniref:Putative peroxisomal membrane protein pex31 n=1 Tax=Uncinula necator TaxID=52586 RepID=A0A0B1P5D2_UNCNE|nr:putative peroxisomal membrane protein pex31 [Erysiphe necator]
MAAFDTPWVMSSIPGSNQRVANLRSTESDSHNPPTTAAFSPVNLSNTWSTNKRRSLIFVHQKSSLLLSTPPQITRVLVYSNLFLLPLNKLVGLLTWTSGDPWESFILVISFWAIVLYSDVAIRYAAPLITSIVLSLCVYIRKCTTNPFTFSTRQEKVMKHNNNIKLEASSVNHQKTLEEIVETLRTFTNRCHVAFDPFLDLIDFLEAQWSKSMSPKHLLNSILTRFILLSIIWIALNLEPIQLITPKRSILFIGTLLLTWHSQPNRMARIILWRSTLVRRFCGSVTGLQLTVSTDSTDLVGNKKPTSASLENLSQFQESIYSDQSLKSQKFTHSFGVRFTFIIYENQRRWVGLGWTTNLFAYERAAWTDEYLSPVPPKDKFQLPDVEDSSMAWKWVDGSIWMIEGVGAIDEGSNRASVDIDEKMGWIYYDNKWQHGRRGMDGWGCYTRRRKWYRDAELVEVPLPSKMQ